MKVMNALLTTTALVLAVSASATKNFEGTFVGAQIGTSKASSVKPTMFKNGAAAPVSASSLPGYKRETKYGLNGGILAGHRMAVAQDVILGVSLGVDLENTKQKESLPNDNLSEEVKRKYIVNLLGQAGYTVTKDVLAFVTAGVSYAKIKFNAKEDDGSFSKEKGKFGYVVGAGAAYAINETVSADLQYLYTGYGKTKAERSIGTDSYTMTAPKAYHTVTVGVKVKI